MVNLKNYYRLEGHSELLQFIKDIVIVGDEEWLIKKIRGEKRANGPYNTINGYLSGSYSSVLP